MVKRPKYQPQAVDANTPSRPWYMERSQEKIKERYFLWLELITLIWIRICFLHNRNVVTSQTIKKLNDLYLRGYWYLKSLLQLNFDVHVRITCFSKLSPYYLAIFQHSTKGGHTFLVRFMKNWNSLETTLKKSRHIDFQREWFIVSWKN